MYSISNQRGFSLNMYPASFSFVLVKAEIEEVSSSLANIVNGSLIKDVYKNPEQVDTNFLLVWQYTNHDWTMFEYLVCRGDIPRKLSKTLKTDCIYFQYEDVSGWEGYNLFKDGEIVESYSFGLDYREEMAEAFEEEGGMPEQLDHGIPWDINTADNQLNYQFLFRSTLRSVAEDEIKSYKSFLNNFFISQSAWLPSWQDTPWFSENQPPTIPESNFVRVDFITQRSNNSGAAD